MFTRIVCFSLLTLCGTEPALLAQISMQTAEPPAVTAENQDWYLSGDPLAYGGAVFYPSGAIVHFNRNEMVQTGYFDNVPIYVRTTQEPRSVIYVPLAGGVMKPYERRRTGELAGTVGSSAPGFPVMLPQQSAQQTVSSMGFARVPTDPIGGGAVGTSSMANTTVSGSAGAQESVGTSGVVAMAPSQPTPTRLQTARRPVGLNSVYLDFDNARWFASGPAVEFSTDRFTRIGEHRGFPVYVDRARADVIYIPLVPGAPGLVSTYKRR
jgi:hypothetical protein